MTGLVLTSALGKVFFANGRGGYSELGIVSLEDALASFDRYAAWVAAGDGSSDDDGSPEMRALVEKAYAEALQVTPAMHAVSDDDVPLFQGGAS